MRWWFSTPLWARIFGGMAAGVALGFALRPELGIASALGLDAEAVSAGLKLAGDAFVRLIRMLAVPLIFVSVAAAVVSLEDIRKLGATGGRVMALYLPSGFLATGVGMGFATLLQPGVISTPLAPPAGEVVAKAPPTPQDIINQVIPVNPVQALANGDMIAVIVFALLFGVGMLGAREASKPVAEAIDGAGAALTKLVVYIMELAPFGAFALMAWVVGALGAEALVRLGALIFCVYLGLVFYGVVIYGAVIKLWLKLPLIPFFRGIAPALTLAYASASSNATLPVTLQNMTERLGVSKRMAAFVASLGATINMDGSALHMATVAIFGAQLFGVELQTADYFAILFTATIGAIGVAGIPLGTQIFVPAVLASAGIPIEVLAIYAGIDRVLDMARTTLNVLGDAVAGVAVAKWEGELDAAAYRGSKASEGDPA